MADMFSLPNDADTFNLSDLVENEWLGPVVNATDLTDFPDDAIAASLAAFSGRDEDDGEVMPDRLSTRSPGLMRSSFSMNDLTALQQQPVPSPWNHKLVSMKPKLQPVPEGGPSNGGPLNLMPLSGGLNAPHAAGMHHQQHSMSNGGSHLSGHTASGMGMHHQPPLGMQLQHGSADNPHAGIPGLDSDLDDFVDFDSEEPGLHRQLPSTGSLTQQLQMTHVRSDRQLTALVDQGSTQHMASGYGNGMQQQPQVSMFDQQAVESLADGVNNDMFGVQDGFLGMDFGPQGGPGGVGPSAPPPTRPPTGAGYPLRKSQSAVELGSWRSFSGGEDMWELEVLAGLDASGKPSKLSPEERLARIARYREKRGQRSHVAGHGGPAPNGRMPAGVKAQCRKTLADTRLRVKGRFARAEDVMTAAAAGDPSALRGGGYMRGVMHAPHSPQGSGGAHTSSGGPSSSGGPGGGGSAGLVGSQSSGHHGATSAPTYSGVVGGPMALTSAGRALSLPPMMPPPPPAALPGISVIGATPTPMLHPDPGLGPSGLGPLGVPSSHGPPLMAGSFPPMPAVVGPSSGGLAMAPPSSLPAFGGGMLPLPYMSAGQTIFTGQTLFGGSISALSPNSSTMPGSFPGMPAHPGMGGLFAGSGAGHVPSVSASAHPSLSPPPHAPSPAHSDSHSHSVGLSLGDFSTG